MIILEKLYSEPKLFEPVKFETGLNFILGERSEGNKKTNGVGKSISIEFLNFCLLKKPNESRVLLIPKNYIEPETNILLDLKFNNSNVTISRNVYQPDLIIIYINGKEIKFEKLDDASNYLGTLYFEEFPAQKTRISFRNLLGPIIRDERSEFKDIIKCFDTDKRIPPDFKPHLFFLGLNIELYAEIKKIIDRLDKVKTYFSETKKILTNNNEIKVNDAKAKSNELEHEVHKINTSIEELRNKDSFDLIQDEIISIETEISILRTKQKALKSEIKQIDSLPKPENISETDLALLFNQFKSGLGDAINKSLNDVKEFKNKIDNFKNTIINTKLTNLKNELSEINQKIREYDEMYSEKLSLCDNGELLRDIKTSINIYNKKNQEFNNLQALIERYDKAEKNKKSLKAQKDNNIIKFEEKALNNNEIIKEFEKTILHIHENIIGNREAHFEINTKNQSKSKEFLSFDLRIDDDGSWSTERLKVFIYDVALLFDKNTKINHPRFLVHDNIFNIDNDSLEKCLNYLHKQAENRPEEFQYILTINRDMVELMEEREQLDFKIDEYRRAFYTKEDRFLKIKYNEIKK